MTVSIPKEGYEVSEDGQLSIYVRGIPYGGPPYLGERDFSGEYFSKNTDTGPLDRVVSYYDHGKFLQSVPVNHPAREVMSDFSRARVGVAEKILTDDEGEIWKVIVDQAYNYKNLLLELAREKLIRASSHPFQRSVVINEKTKHIDRWDTVEMTLTVRSDNPEAEMVYGKIMKQLGEDILMAKRQIEGHIPTPMPTDEQLEEKTTQDPPVPQDPPGNSPATPVAPVVPTPESEPDPVVNTPPSSEEAEKEEAQEEDEKTVKKKTAKERVDAAFEKAEAKKEEAKTGEEDQEKTLTAQDIASLLQKMDYLTVSLSGYASMEKTMKDMQKSFEAKFDLINSEIQDLYDAFPELAEKTADKLEVRLQTEFNKTDAERMAEKSYRKREERIEKTKDTPGQPKSDLPEGAPR